MLVVFGSINADLLFRVEALPKPGETVLCPGWSFAPGGKGANQAAAAAKAGAEVAFVGRIGDDAYGPILRQDLEAAGVSCGGLRRSARPTGTAVIAIDDHGENAIIVASGANLDVTEIQLEGGWLGPGRTLLCQNEIPPSATHAAIHRASLAGARTILNLAPAAVLPTEVLADLDVLVVNEHEAATLVGQQGAPADLASALARAHELTCVVTLGAAGTLAVGPSGAWRAGVLAVDIVDTTGAGDAFTGVLAACFDQGRSMPDALARASVAAGLCCERLGARDGQPSALQIEARLADLPPVVQLATP